MADIDPFEDVNQVELGGNAAASITKAANEMIALEGEVAALEADLKARKAKLAEVQERKLPDLMFEIGIKEFVLTDGRRLTVKDMVVASIPSKSAIDKAKDEERGPMLARQGEAFKWLEKNGHGDLIKNDLVIGFKKGEAKQAKALVTELRKRGINVEVNRSVNPQSLGAFCREQLAAGKALPLDVLGVHQGRKAQLKKGK